MSNVLVLFNLKEGVDSAEYERWAKTRDLPTARNLSSVDQFNVLKSNGMFGTDAPAPYQYVELLQVNDFEKLGDEAGEGEMAAVAAEFAEYADNPQFIILQDIE